MVATIQTKTPDLFTNLQSDGTCFKCSDAFVKKFLHKSMGWSERRATKAAQKLPTNHEEILMNAFLHEAYVVHDHAVPADLCVNTNQTQMVYQQGTQRTWNESGAKQVSTTGQEEKRAFTLVPISVVSSSQCRPSSWGKCHGLAQVVTLPHMLKPRSSVSACFLRRQALTGRLKKPCEILSTLSLLPISKRPRSLLTFHQNNAQCGRLIVGPSTNLRSS